MEWFVQSFPGFLLVFCRISSFLVTAPIFSTRTIPPMFKIGISFFVALISFATLGASATIEFDALYILAVFKEVLVGLLLGFLAYIFFTVAQIAGSFIDMQMGFGMANMIDPLTGASVPILGNLKFMIATLLFLTFNGHHFLIQGIMDSYAWIPLQNELFARIYSGQVSEFLLRSFAVMFTLAFQLAAPMVVALFLADTALGILAKTAPQFNVFVVGFPLKILIGFLLLLLLVPSYLHLFRALFVNMFEAMRDLMQIIA